MMALAMQFLPALVGCMPSVARYLRFQNFLCRLMPENNGNLPFAVAWLVQSKQSVCSRQSTRQRRASQMKTTITHNLILSLKITLSIVPEPVLYRRVQ